MAGVAIVVAGLLTAPAALHAQRPPRIVGALAYSIRGDAQTPLHAEIIPIVEFARGRYTRFPTTARDSQPGSPEAIRRSILDQVRDFTIYTQGRTVGTVRVTRVVTKLYGCRELVVGMARGRVGATQLPSFGFATSPTLATQDFYRGRTLGPEAKTAVEAAVRAELKRAFARHPGRHAPEAIGEPRVDSAWVLDVDRDSTLEVVAEAVIPLRKPTTPGDVYSDFAAVLVIKPTGSSASVLLSLPAGPLSTAKRPYRFRAALDVTDNGIAELFIARTAYEGETTLVFELRSNAYVLAGEGPYIGC